MLNPSDGLDYWDRQAYTLGVKVAEDANAANDAAVPTPSYSMTGTLYLKINSKNEPWLMLSVPAALVRGVFDGLHEPGIELPLDSKGMLTPHVSCIRPEEILLAGGPDAFRNDRGKPFKYNLGQLIEFEPDGWKEMDRCWVLKVHSPELQQMRISHGLPALPKYPFHLTCAVRRRGILSRNDKAKDTTPA